MIGYALRRLLNDKRLSLAMLLGLAVAIAIASAVPIYADASSLRALQDRLAVNRDGVETARLPFSFMFSYLGSLQGSLDIERLDGVNAHLMDYAPAALDLPMLAAVRHVRTPQFTLFPDDDAFYDSARRPLAWTNLAYATGLEEHVTLVEGGWPSVASQASDVVEVVIGEGMAGETGLGPGEALIAYRAGEAAGGSGHRTQVSVRIVGVWRANDPHDAYWFVAPESLDAMLIMPEASFRQAVAPLMRDEVNVAIWYWVASHDWVRSDDVLPTLRRLARVTNQATSLLPGISLVLSPADALRDYRASAYALMLVLAVFAVPIVALVCVFLVMISANALRSRRREIAVLRSRGASAQQVLLVHLVEGVLIVLVALPLGLAGGLGLARVIGDTTAFLRVGTARNLEVAITSSAWIFGLGAVVVGLVARLLPSLGAASHTVVSYQGQRTRDLGSLGWWPLDLMLTLAAGYAYYVLQQRGSAAAAAAVEPLRDPLLFAAPVLALLALSLVTTRLFPYLMLLVEKAYRLVGRGVVWAVSLAELAREARGYVGSLLMVILTTSFATYFASVALTLDEGVWDRSLYRTGATFRLIETGVASAGASSALAEGDASTGGELLAEGSWLLASVEQHLAVPGITAATRVGSYPVSIRSSAGNQPGMLYGIDRLTFPEVAFFREDFAEVSLGALMNALAATQRGVLISERYARAHQVALGDTIGVSFGAYGERKELVFTVVGLITHFPTHYDEASGYPLVANLSEVFQQIGFSVPYDVWVETEPGMAPSALEQGLMAQRIPVSRIDDGSALASSQKGRPEWAGFVGILSAGFAAAAVLTMLAFILDALVSLRLRFVEFGVLRAIGLSMGQMAEIVSARQLLVALFGTSVGTGVGVVVSHLYVPHLAVGGSFGGSVPSVLVRIAWGDIVAVYLALLVALATITLSTVLMLRRARIFEAIKLGQTT